MNFFSWTERPADSKLGNKDWCGLYINYSYNSSDRESRIAAMTTVLKIYFELLLNKKANWLKIAKLVWYSGERYRAIFGPLVLIFHSRFIGLDYHINPKMSFDHIPLLW